MTDIDTAAEKLWAILNREEVPRQEIERPSNRRTLIGVKLAEERLKATMRKCPRCGEDKPLTEFKRRPGRTWYCLECAKLYHRDYELRKRRTGRLIVSLKHRMDLYDQVLLYAKVRKLRVEEVLIQWIEKGLNSGRKEHEKEDNGRT